MAELPGAAVVSVEEYLADYSRVEYVDGALVERNAGSIPHSRLQRDLLIHFGEHRRGIAALPRCCTRTASTRFRLPDVIVIRTPFDRKARFYSGIPVAVIEIVSWNDKMPDVLQRFEEYEALGVPHIIQMDPERGVTRVYREGNLLRQELQTITDGDLSIPFDTKALYAELNA